MMYNRYDACLNREINSSTVSSSIIATKPIMRIGDILIPFDNSGNEAIEFNKGCTLVIAFVQN